MAEPTPSPEPTPQPRPAKGITGPFRFDFRAATIAGLLAGLVFLVLEMAMVPMFLGGSAWGPPRMIGAIALGPEVLPPPATFDLGVVTAALVAHSLLSVLYAMILGPLVQRLGKLPASVVGVVFGLVLYLLNFHFFTVLFPWFADARNWVTITSHGIFGLLAAVFQARQVA